LDAARQGHEAERRTLQERLDATELHWMKQVDEARQALSAEHKQLEALERQRTAEVGKLREELERLQAERAHLQLEFARTTEALAASRTECAHLQAAAHKRDTRADEAMKGLQEVQAAAREQFEALQRQLREALGRPRRLSPQQGRRRLSDIHEK
ncbi:MAG: hypothetical protein WB439_06800, partial [Acidobacteriaceae bacterium]